MSKILKYSDWLVEKYQLQQNDPPEITSQKKSFNELENFITDYNNKKVTLDNIYKTYVDDKDLMNKLKSQGFLKGTPTDYKKIQFQNPLLDIHAQISRKMREIANIQDLIKSDEETIQNKETISKDVSGNDTKKTLDDDISQVQQKISDNQEKIKKLDSEIFILKKQIDSQINKMKKQLIDSQKRINTEQAD